MFHSSRVWFQTMSCVLVGLLMGGSGSVAWAAASRADPRSVAGVCR